MANKNITKKQPSEYFPVIVNFANVLAVSESITTGSNVTSYDNSSGIQVSGSTILDESTITWTGPFLQANVISGSDNTTYKLSFKGVTTFSNIYEEDIFVVVKNI